MTLILSANRRETVIQVGDRLVSQVSPGREPKPLDVLSNKSVIYRATDGIVTIGFSGRARLEDKRTDLWLAELLVGMEVGEEGGIVFLDGGREPLDVFHLWMLIKAEVERVFTSLRGQRYLSHSFVLAGWQRTRRDFAKPLLWRLDNEHARPNEFHFVNLLKDRADWIDNFVMTPTGSFDPAIIDETLHESAQATTPASLEKALVSGIRKNADVMQGIGKDCLSIQIRPDVDPQVTIRFIPEKEATVATQSTQGKPISLPFAFSPWIISGNALIPPNLLIGHPPMMAVGELWCRFESPVTEDAANYPFAMKSVSEMRRIMYAT